MCYSIVQNKFVVNQVVSVFVASLSKDTCTCLAALGCRIYSTKKTRDSNNTSSDTLHKFAITPGHMYTIGIELSYLL